jgi:hypothetical protein
MRFASEFARSPVADNLVSLHVSNVRARVRAGVEVVPRTDRGDVAGGATRLDEADASARSAAPTVWKEGCVAAVQQCQIGRGVGHNLGAVLSEPGLHHGPRVHQPLRHGQRDQGGQRTPRNGGGSNGALFAMALRGHGRGGAAVVFGGLYAQRGGHRDVFAPVLAEAAAVVGGDVDVQVSWGSGDAGSNGRGDARGLSQRGAGQVYCSRV